MWFLYTPTGCARLYFGKSVSDNGFGLFVSMLDYKLREKGKQAVKIDKWFPSSNPALYILAAAAALGVFYVCKLQKVHTAWA